MREKWAKKQEDETKVDPEPELEPPEYGPFYNTELPFVGGLTKIWCWNCDGVRSVMRNGKFQEFMEEVKPQILCLNETKVDEESMEKHGVKEELEKWFPYDLQFWNASKRMRGYAGTAILISRDFEGGKPDKVEYDGFGEPGVHDQEGRTITCHFEHFLLVVTYVPNAGVWSSRGNVLGLERLDYRVNEWDKDF